MVLQTYASFLDKFFAELEKTGVDYSDLVLDHLAYQTSSAADYEKVKTEFLNEGKLISESIVGRRRVGIIKLKKALNYKNYMINIVEVIEPKKEQKVDSHWDHVEMTVPTTLEDFMKKYPDLDWETKALNREIFPMLILKLNNDIQVKFPRNGVLKEVKRLNEKSS